MNKLFPLIINVLISFTVFSSCRNSESSPESGPVYPLNKTPEWMRDEPIVMAGNWDSAPIFRTRKGGYQAWDTEDYPRTHSEEAVIKLKEMGVTMAMIHFYKGFGLEAEKPQLEDAKRLAALCKKHGIRVGCYIGSTVAYETFLPEKPEAESWFVPDYMGQPVLYGSQSFRKRVYFMHPGYREYMKQVVKIAVEELHADLIHFDNTSMRGAPQVFYHPLAVTDFREYLRKSYSPEQLKERLGFSNVDYVEPPRFTTSIQTMTDPLFQLWTDFRCSQLSAFYGEMEAYIQKLNPEVAVENNPHSGLSGRNTIWEQSIDYPRLLAHTDAVWSEEGNDAAYTEDERLVSKIRSYKMAGILNNTIFTYTGDNKLKMAEAMAYNRQCLGMIGGMLAGFELTENRKDHGFDNPYTEGTARETSLQMKEKAEYIKFFRSNFKYFRNMDNVADVAVLHSSASMAFDSDRPYQSTYLVEQTLIQKRIQFDIIFDENLKDLSKYQVLVLADQKCLSDNSITLIIDFVKRGGGLVITEHTSLYDEKFARRKDFGLKELIQIDAPVWRGYNKEELLQAGLKKISINGGHVAYIPEIKPAISKPSGIAMTSQYWKLPVNHDEITESIRWASGRPLSLEIQAPDFVTGELKCNPDRSLLVLHLINYKVEKEPLVKGININIEIPKDRRLVNAGILSPEREDCQSVTYQVIEGRIRFTVPELNTCCIVIIESASVLS